MRSLGSAICCSKKGRSIDAAREKWWIGLRSAEREQYNGLGKDFSKDEKFYRSGFQAAMHARTRGKEYDQVLAEMHQDLEELKRQCQNPEDVEAAFERGYERGRAYFESTRKPDRQ
jgi:ADP-dependent phosphofructokinase/glucokinase